MALAALISAVRDAREPGIALRATFWLGGLTLVERQARLAASAGASLIVVLVESLPGELVQAIERLRKSGIEIVTVRSAAEAATAVPSGFRLILIADGFVGTDNHVARLMGDDRPVLLAVTDRGFDEKFERIDSVSRWAGLGLIDSDLLRDAALMPSDWDLQSTLLRRAIQTGVRAVPLTDERETAELAIVERGQDLAELQRRILGGAEGGARNFLSRLVLQPVERAITGAIMTSQATPLLIGIVTLFLTAFAAIAFALDWRWVGLLALLLAMPLEGVAMRLARLRLQPGEALGWWRTLRPALLATALMLLADRVASTHGWGMILLAATTIAFAVALGQELRSGTAPGADLLADAPVLTMLILVAALFGLWATGLFIVATYVCLSFFWAQYHRHRKPGLAGG